MRFLKPVTIALMLSFLSVSTAWATGFFLYDHDPKAQAQSSAFTAQADTPSALWYNPAGISQLDGTQVTLNSSFVRLESTYKNLQGQKQELQAEWAPIPNFFITSDFGTEKFTAGLGIGAPFGLSTSWSDTGLLRYVATDTSLSMININPSIAYQILPELSVAAGIDYYNLYSYVAKSKFNFLIGDADVKLDADGDGWGFNLAGFWQPHPKHSFGLSYRSRVKTTLEGKLKYKDIPAGIGYPPAIEYDISTKLTLPSIVNGGYAFRPIDKLKLEFDVYWIEWSTVHEEKVKNKATDSYLVINDKDWKDTFMFCLGGEYLINQNLAFRAGYAYAQNAVPEKTYNPNVPDSNCNIFSLGLGITLERLNIDLAYSYGYYTNRNVDNNVGAIYGTTVDGKYDTNYHNIGAGASYKF